MKYMTPKEIHEDIIQLLAEYLPSYASENKLDVEFKLRRSRIDYLGLFRTKSSATANTVRYE